MLYNKNTQPTQSHGIFNNWDIVTKGWYIALKSQEINIGCATSKLIGHQRIVFFRGQSGKVYALDAFCPHMGVDLGLGQVVGENLQCHFHHWQYDRRGRCVHIPCQSNIPEGIQLSSYAIEEKYGYIWIWPDETPDSPLPDVPGLEEQTVISKSDKAYFRRCHYHITMVNGIDAQHLNTIHSLSVKMQPIISEPRKDYFNVKMSGEFTKQNKRTKWMSWLFGGRYSYNMLYTHGSIGFLTMMQDVRLFGKFKVPTLNMLYAYNPLQEKQTQIIPIYITKQRRGAFGYLKSSILLYLTKRFFYFLKDEDGQIYENIQFNTNRFLKIDQPIAKYVAYINRLTPSKWSKA